MTYRWLPMRAAVKPFATPSTRFDSPVSRIGEPGSFRVKRWNGLSLKEARMQRFLSRVAVERVLGQHPSPVRALAASAVAGTAVAGLTYRLLRNGSGNGDDES
jgi:hypothetical protein